ncbi:MAG TPA: DUF2283 domain-containing protein [Solirubrobacterales bacterium]
MIVCLGNHEFDHVVYDAEGDVLYLSRGEPAPARTTLPSLEGHAVRLNDADEIIGITIVGVKWWAERDGRITITIPDSTCLPERLETSAEELAPALAA